ncbi:hypothetical protein SODG_001109 [Sodalis praecaptivus]
MLSVSLKKPFPPLMRGVFGYCYGQNNLDVYKFPHFLTRFTHFRR